MDLQSHRYSATVAGRVTRFLALSCFLAACCLLLGSLALTSAGSSGLDASLMQISGTASTV